MYKLFDIWANMIAETALVLSLSLYYYLHQIHASRMMMSYVSILWVRVNTIIDGSLSLHYML